jgi:ribonuclease-3
MNTISDAREEMLSELENKINYSFIKKYLLNRSMTHSSYANQYGLPYIEHNERLEFLGDSVLSLVVSEFIFKRYKNKPEGKLTKIRANIVCEASLSERAKKMELGSYLLIGRGEEITGGREKTSMLADAYEALIAAMYMDGGLECAKNFVISELSESIEQAVKGPGIADYKTQLQEHVQKDAGSTIKYEVVSEEGPAHNKIFTVEVSINERVTGKGQGKSKKQAEQQAAKAALSSVTGDAN